jgi:hypothetical protein
MHAHINRWRFLQASAAGAAGLTILADSRSAVAFAANEKLNIAGIGVGGQGGHDLRSVAGENIVALCDVDDRRAAGSYKQFPKARRFDDFRKMLDAMDKDIDAVVVGTPDHTHAVACMAAMKRGKQVAAGFLALDELLDPLGLPGDGCLERSVDLRAVLTLFETETETRKCFYRS